MSCAHAGIHGRDASHGPSHRARSSRRRLFPADLLIELDPPRLPGAAEVGITLWIGTVRGRPCTVRVTAPTPSDSGALGLVRGSPKAASASFVVEVLEGRLGAKHRVALDRLLTEARASNGNEPRAESPASTRRRGGHS